MRKYVINCLLLLFLGADVFSQGCSDVEFEDSSFLVLHGDLSLLFIEGLENNLSFIEGSELVEKDYAVKELKYRISEIKQISNSSDTSDYEKLFVRLQDSIDNVFGNDRVVFVSSCMSGEMFSCSEVIITQKGNDCVLYRFDLKNNLIVKKCSTEKLNDTVVYLKNRSKRKMKKYENVIRIDDSFDFFVVEQGQLFSGFFYYTYEFMDYDVFLKTY